MADGKLQIQGGFTLVELMVVISIIVILAIIALLYLRGQLFKGNDAKRKGDINRISVAVEEYEKDHNCYPAFVRCGTDASQPVYPYLNQVPCDPVTEGSYYYDIDTKNASCPKWFRLSGRLENAADPLAMGYCGPGGIYNYYQGSANAPSCQYTQRAGAYGCKSGVCIPILWDNSKPGWACDPTFGRRDCYGQCASVECTPWR